MNAHLRKGLKRIRQLLNKLLIDSDYLRSQISYDIWLEASVFKWASTYVVSNQIVGDYLEFGVYQGRRFGLMYQLLNDYSAKFYSANPIGENPWSKISFHAFDSFQGLPESDRNWRPAQYEAGAYKASIDEFVSNIKAVRLDANRLTITPGWFADTLSTSTAEKIKLQKISVAFIDCDVLESTAPILDFIQPHLQTGTVLIFDDWFQNKGEPLSGVQGATLRWLSANRDITLQFYHASDTKSWAFIVHKGEYPPIVGIRA